MNHHMAELPVAGLTKSRCFKTLPLADKILVWYLFNTQPRSIATLFISVCSQEMGGFKKYI